MIRRHAALSAGLGRQSIRLGAARELEAFVDDVKAQRGVHVTQQAADGLIVLAEQLLLQWEGQSQRGSVGLTAPLTPKQSNLLTRLRDRLGWLVEWLEANLFNPGPVARGDVARAAPFIFNSPIGGQGLGDEVVIDYTYDDLYRLTSAVYSTGESYTYSYDPVGNRTQQMVNGAATSSIPTTPPTA